MRHLSGLLFRVFVSAALVVQLSACGSSTPAPDHYKGVVKIGKPYHISGKRYYPAYDPEYDEVGDASWYGPGFHGKPTASGEPFNTYDLTAAHTTLPMPSLVRVTNLENGRSIVVRINDRGPFAHDRIIDLSEKAADELGIKQRGTAKVRVQYLAEETEQLIAELRSGRSVQQASFQPGRQPAPHVTPVAFQDSNDFRAAMGGSQSDMIQDSGTRAMGNAAPMGLVASNELPPLPGLAPAPVPPTPNPLAMPDFPPQLPPASAPAPVAAPAPAAVPFTPPPQQPSYAPPAQPFRPPVSVPAAEVKNLEPSAGGNLFIQAGSFSQRENADKLAARLSGVGTPDVRAIQVGDRMWYRVRVGPVADRMVAEQMLSKVIQLGVPDARIITN